MQVRHGLIAACALRLEVEVPLRQSRGCRDCAHVGISVRRRQGLTSTREAVPYAEASAEVRSAIWRSFSVIPPSEWVVQRTVTRR